MDCESRAKSRWKSCIRSHTFHDVSAQDRGWSIAPTLLTFVGVLAGSLFLLDGNFSALADRLTTKRDPEANGGAGPI